MEFSDLERIIEAVKKSDILTLELEQEGTRIRITRAAGGVVRTFGPASTAVSAASSTAGEGGSVAAGEIPAPAASAEQSYTQVRSPIVGTFYRRPAPDADAFAREGDRVKKGDTLCIVEAMKVMNEIEAPCDGVVEKILLNDGQVVEYDEILFLIDPST